MRGAGVEKPGCALLGASGVAVPDCMLSFPVDPSLLPLHHVVSASTVSIAKRSGTECSRQSHLQLSRLVVVQMYWRLEDECFRVTEART